MKTTANIIENINDQYDDLSYWSVLKNQTSSVYDLLSSLRDLTDDELDAIITTKHDDSTVQPYINVYNLNKNPDKYCQECIKPKTAIEVGVKFEF